MIISQSWSRLSKAEQLTHWRSFIEALDAGDAGYHPWRPVLMPLWEFGEMPEALDDGESATRDPGTVAQAPRPLQLLPDLSLALALGEPPF